MLSWCSSSLFWNMCHHCMPLLCLSELNWLLLMFCSNSVLLWVARSAGFRHQVQFDKEEKAQREEETQGKEGGRGSRGEWNVGYVGNMWEVCEQRLMNNMNKLCTFSWKVQINSDWSQLSTLLTSVGRWLGRRAIQHLGMQHFRVLWFLHIFWMSLIGT